MCKQVVRVYPLCTPDQPQPPWHETVDETVQCQEAVNRSGIPCEELEEPQVLTVKNSRCAPCLLRDRQEHDAHQAWEKQALAESERLAADHAQQLAQRQAKLAQEEEEHLQRIIQESERMAREAPVEQRFLDNEEELRKALEASMGTTQEDEQRRAAFSEDEHGEELRKAIEASMGTNEEDEQRRTERAGPRIFFVRHVRKICCGKVTKEKTDIEKDADSDGIPFLEEEDYMPCDDCVRRMFAEQDALNFGGSSTGADVPTVRTGQLPPEFSGVMLHDSAAAATEFMAEAVDLAPTASGKAPLYSDPQNAPTLDSPAGVGHDFNQTYPPVQAQTEPASTNIPDSSPPGYMSSINLSSSVMAPSPGRVNAIESTEITHLHELSPEEEEEEIRKQCERHAQLNASMFAQDLTGAPNNAQAPWSRGNKPSLSEHGDDQDESRPASPRTVMANKQQEDVAREHLAAARANLRDLEQQQARSRESVAFGHSNRPGNIVVEDEDALGDLPANLSHMYTASTIPSSSGFRRGGLRPSCQVPAGSSSSSARHDSNEPQDHLPGVSPGPEAHDWNHDWLGEEGNQSERLPSFASSLDVSRGTRPVPDQETE